MMPRWHCWDKSQDNGSFGSARKHATGLGRKTETDIMTGIPVSAQMERMLGILFTDKLSL